MNVSYEKLLRIARKEWPPCCKFFVNFRTPVIFDKLSEHVKLRIGNLAKIPFLETFWEWHLYSKKITNISPFKTELILKFSIGKQHKNFNNVGSFVSSDPQGIRRDLDKSGRLLGIEKFVMSTRVLCIAQCTVCTCTCTCTVHHGYTDWAMHSTRAHVHVHCTLYVVSARSTFNVTAKKCGETLHVYFTR